MAADGLCGGFFPTCGDLAVAEEKAFHRQALLQVERKACRGIESSTEENGHASAAWKSGAYGCPPPTWLGTSAPGAGYYRAPRQMGVGRFCGTMGRVCGGPR